MKEGGIKESKEGSMNRRKRIEGGIKGGIERERERLRKGGKKRERGKRKERGGRGEKDMSGRSNVSGR